MFVIMRKMSLSIGLLVLLLLASSFTPKKVRRMPQSSPYASLPAKLITEQSKLDMLHSIQDLDSGRLFFLNYTEDYKLGDLIARNATTNESLIEFILSNLCDKNIPAKASLSYGAGCSAFSATTLDGNRIMGRNFDYSHGNEPIAAAIVQTTPKNGLKSVCIVDGYWVGYRQGLWQCFTEDKEVFNQKKERDLSYVMGFPYLLMDGMNEAGFAIGVLHLDGKPTQQRSDLKHSLTTTVMMRCLLDNATSVDSAVDILRKYNLHIPHGQGNYHFYMADASGKHAVVEYVYSEEYQDVRFIDDEYEECQAGKLVTKHRKMDVLPNEMKVMKDKHCVSNFYLSPSMAVSEKGPVLSKHGRARYDMMDFVLSQNKDILSEENAMTLLNFVSQAENPTDVTSHTQWSAVYNLSKGKVTICINRNYNKQFVFDLKTGRCVVVPNSVKTHKQK